MAQYNNAQVRKWLTAFFQNEEDFNFFAEDNFPEIFAQFAEVDSLNKKGRLIAQHCEDKHAFEQLFTLIKNEDPARFAEFPPPDPIEAAMPTAEQTTPLPEPATLPQTEPVPASDAERAPPTTTAASPVPVEDMPEEPADYNQVFISYSRRDLEFVSELYQGLTARNVSAWFDQSSIEVADHWRTSIVEGIKNCDVFVLVMSPESLASVNVRKEVDLAERYKKRIIPLRWISSDIPVAFDYQLAGLQYIRFDQTPTEEKFNQLAEVVRRLVGGANYEEATRDKSVVEAALVAAVQKEPGDKATPQRRTKLGRKVKVEAIAIGGLVIAGVVTRFGLETEDQDFINEQLKWLFRAVDHAIKIRDEKIDISEPISVPLPPEAEVLAGANNNRVYSLEVAAAQASASESLFERIQTLLSHLDQLLRVQAELGESAASDTKLRYQIKTNRLSIIEDVRLLASNMEQAYGIKISGPDLLLDFVKNQ